MFYQNTPQKLQGEGVTFSINFSPDELRAKIFTPSDFAHNTNPFRNATALNAGRFHMHAVRPEKNFR